MVEAVRKPQDHRQHEIAVEIVIHQNLSEKDRARQGVIPL